MADTGHHQRKNPNTTGRDMTDYRLSTQAKSEKVTIMVGTFLKEEIVKVPFSKTEAEKGSRYGGYLFLKEESVKVSASKKTLKGYQYGGNLFE